MISGSPVSIKKINFMSEFEVRTRGCLISNNLVVSRHEMGVIWPWSMNSEWFHNTKASMHASTACKSYARVYVCSWSNYSIVILLPPLPLSMLCKKTIIVTCWQKKSSIGEIKSQGKISLIQFHFFTRNQVLTEPKNSWIFNGCIFEKLTLEIVACFSRNAIFNEF